MRRIKSSKKISANINENGCVPLVNSSPEQEDRKADSSFDGPRSLSSQPGFGVISRIVNLRGVGIYLGDGVLPRWKKSDKEKRSSVLVALLPN